MQNTTEIHNIGHFLREGQQVKAYTSWETLRDKWEKDVEELVLELRKEFGTN